ncbi:MAG: hypothetical protein WC321_06615 [Candidatus Omnitrophota bacterium]
MEKWAKVSSVASVLLVIYCLISKLAGQPMVNFGILHTTSVGGMVFAVYLAQLAILLKLCPKK